MSETKTVLITGAAGGIGRATVAFFAEKSWRVVGVDRNPFGDGFPKNGLFIQSDIARPEEMHAIFERTRAFTHTLDVLVNNAAYQIAKPLIETSVEEWDSVMASNLRSVFSKRKAGTFIAQNAWRRDCKCVVGSCNSNLGKHRRLCRIQRRTAGFDACHGD